MDSYDIIENAVKEYWKQTGSPHEVVAFFIRNTKMNQRINGNTYSNICEKPTPLGVGWIAQNIKIMCM